MDAIFDLVLRSDSAHFVEWLTKSRQQGELLLHEEITGENRQWVEAFPRGQGGGWLTWDGTLYTYVDGRENPLYQAIGELMHLDIRDTGLNRVQVVCKQADLTIAQAQGLLTATQRAAISLKVSAYAARVKGEIRRVFAVIETTGNESRLSTVNIYNIAGDLVEGDKSETIAGGDIVGRDKAVSNTHLSADVSQASSKTTTNSKPAQASEYPYDSFRKSFREIASPKIYSATGSVLNLVFGNIADIRYTTVVVPINQSFDFAQRGRRSVLASFEKIMVGGNSFFDAIENLWPVKERPQDAGKAQAKQIQLPPNSQQLDGAIFVVTTRNLSKSSTHYGRYVDTPIEGIDYVLDKVLELVRTQKIPSIALPLLGTGYANVDVSINHPELRLLLQQIVLALTIHKLEVQFSNPACELKRGLVVVYSANPQGPEEHQVWEFTLKLLNKEPSKRAEQIEALERPPAAFMAGMG